MSACTITCGDPAAFRRSTTVNLFFSFLSFSQTSVPGLAWTCTRLLKPASQFERIALCWLRWLRSFRYERLVIVTEPGPARPRLTGGRSLFTLIPLCGANTLLWRWVPTPKKRVCTEHVKYLLNQLMQVSLQISLIDCRPQFSCQIYILTFPSVSLFLF